ncbi:ARM repeat superfamily protein [Perilla frutescens var. frutescens]|nr:ARM repeat superfamily protein [Perilla frutescens var. frutescens]
MNRIVKLLCTTTIGNCPKSTQRGFSFLQNGNTQTDMGLKHVCRRNAVNIQTQTRNFSSAYKRVPDEKALEEDAERKIGWVLKLFFAGTATVIGYNLFPYMGENVMQQSVKLLQVKDPLFKRMGAARLARFSIDDKRRMKIVELGGAQGLVNMLAGAKDDRTRQHALKALVAISKSEGAVEALHKAGAIAVIKAAPDSTEYEEVEEYKMKLLARFQDLRYDTSSDL